MKIYAGNLAQATTPIELETAFSAFGAVQSCHIATDKSSGVSKGFGFIEMKNDKEAAAAISGLNGSELGGKTMKVNESRPKPEQSGARA